MSMEKWMHNEHKKLTKEITDGQRKLKKLQEMMREYGMTLYPSPPLLQDLVMECMEANDGACEYGVIYDCLQKHGVNVTKAKLSQALIRIKAIHYSGESGKWELARPRLAA